MTAPIDDTDFIAILSDVGISGTFKVKTTATDSNWGSPSSVSDSSSDVITFIMKPLTLKDELVKQGNANVGDARAWFKKADSVTEGEELVINSVKYRITNLKASSVISSIFDHAVLVKLA